MFCGIVAYKIVTILLKFEQVRKVIFAWRRENKGDVSLESPQNLEAASSATSSVVERKGDELVFELREPLLTT